MDPLAALTDLGGAARWAELDRHGVTRGALRRACVTGLVHREARGLYVVDGAQQQPVTVAVRLNGVLSCGAAAEHHGLEVFGRPSIHVTTVGARDVGRHGPVLHRAPVGERYGAARATPLRQTLRDCCRCLPVAQAVSVLDSAVRQGRVELAELATLVPHSGTDRPAIRRAVRLVDPKAQSVLESAARVLLLIHDLGPVDSQVYVDQVGWVDFLVQGRLVIEVDGYAVHRDRFAEDRRRDAELLRQGFLVLRFTYRDLLRRPQWVVAVIRETLAGHRRARER